MIVEGTSVRTGLIGTMITDMWSGMITTAMKTVKVITAAIEGSSPGLRRETFPRSWVEAP
jgi:hypothetical protein